MTLLVFVRCQDGCILASDRKATSGEGFSQEETKSRVFQRGWAVAGSGNSASAIRSLFTALEDGDITIEDVHCKVSDKLESYNRISRITVSCIVLVAHSGKVDAHIVETSEYGTFHDSIVEPFRCVGEIVPRAVAQHYLRRRDFRNRPCTVAAPEILAILTVACEEGSFVGRLSEYGFDMILFRSNGEYCWKKRVTDEWGILKTDILPIEGISSQFAFSQFDVRERQ